MTTILTVEGWVRHFTDVDMTGDNLMEAMVAVGRNSAPALLADLWAEGHFLFAEEALAEHIGTAWSMSEYPDRCLDHETWRALFELVGYTVDGVRTDRPRQSVRLWRGSVAERRGDWSWTDNREIAERYAGGEHYGRPKGAVWTALVEPWRLLARNTGRNEDEYVVDAEGLDIVEA